VEIVLRALGEAEQKHRKISRSKRDQHPIPAAPPLPPSGDTLLNQPAAEIGIHQPPPCRQNNFGQIFIWDVFTTGKAREGLEFIDSHPTSLVQWTVVKKTAF